MDNKEYIARIVEKIKEEQPEKIILFGSYAYGNPDKQSDIDLFVIKNLETAILLNRENHYTDVIAINLKGTPVQNTLCLREKKLNTQYRSQKISWLVYCN